MTGLSPRLQRERQLSAIERTALLAWWIAHGERVAAARDEVAAVRALMYPAQPPTDTVSVAAWLAARWAHGEDIGVSETARRVGWSRRRLYRLLDVCSRCLPICAEEGRWLAMDARER